MSQPATTFYLGHVPWDSSYRDVRQYASESAQRSGIMGFMNPTFTTSGNTFFRNHARMLRVPFHASTLQEAGVNYIAWQNGSSGKWWYAFVQEIRYLNDDVSNLVIEVDVFQTWWFDITPKACYVEREHTNDDTVGSNILDEPVDTGEFVVNQTNTTDTLKNYTIIVMSAEEPTGTPGDIIAFKKESKGGWSDTMYEGCGMYAFNLQAPAGEDAATWIAWLTRAGGGNSIAAVFMYPTVLMPAGSRYDGTNLFEDSVRIMPGKTEIIYNWGTDLDGYTPRNNKLYTYPFSFVRASNNNASYHDYRFELQNDVDITRSDFQIRGALDPTGDALLIPKNYNGQAYNMQEYLNMGGYPQCSWSYNGYDSWLAQNSGAVGAALLTGALMVAPAAVGLAAGAAALGGTAATAGLVAGGAATVGEVAALGGVTASTAGMALMGGTQLASTAGKLIDASRQSSSVRSASSNVALHGIGYGVFSVMRMSVRAQIAKRIDDFFDVFGYSTQEVKLPNITGRTSWNYVKCRDAAFEGTAPAKDTALINARLNAGVTFWHTDDIGNYALDNSIVG